MIRLTQIATLLFLFTLPAWAQQKAEPGRFDYYVLSLSWSPTWCASKAGREDFEQCGGLRRHGFVVHGLWPQYAKGGFPAQCATPTPLPGKLVEDMLPLMPSRKLIEHEWAKHGTCAGGDAQSYFAATRAARDKLRIPAPFAAPDRPVSVPVAEVERMFIAENPGLTPEAIAVTCRGRHAAEIRVCLTRDLKFRDCGRDIRDRCRDGANFPPDR
ncbi:MAG TPA: ribonuclease T2 [Candidatus Omnitrophota bacterium]|nr:ribonuclease T2 [Candidatus Omnitrophota bacterium]